MRFVYLAFAAVSCAALVAGCSSASSSSSPAGAGDGGPDAANIVTASFDMNVTVGAGQELFKCQFVTLPNVQAFMISGQHQYTPGSHHLLLYTTDLTSIPAGGDQVQDCYEGTNNNIMSHARGVLYAGQVPTGGETLPTGVGLSTSPQQVLLFQVHYLDATSSSLDAKVHVQLSLDTGNDIVTKAGIFFFYDPFIDVPPSATAKATMRCVIPDQVTLVYASSHYHARAVGYGAYLDPSATEMAAKPFYTSDSWSSPPNQQMSMTIPAGTHLRFECDYDNTNGTQEYFQGQSALTNEMCMFIGTYYPEMTQVADYCLSGPDMFGNGAVSCGDTLTCLETCGSITFGKVGGGGGVSECEQKCVVQSCPSASTTLVPVVECVRSSCSTECGTGATGSACSTCVQAKCASQSSACVAHACN
jgi:hypothetical protein